jgi:prepilin-type N-terminal cleavage/methylation domain-containing protein
MKRSPASCGGRNRSAFSLAEIVVTIAIMGLLMAVAIPIYSNLRDASERAIARDHVEALNRAVTNFSHGCWKFPTPANASSTDDEYAVLRSVQYKFPLASKKVGSPFFDPKYDPQPSSNSHHLRIRWNGKTFDLLEIGTTGTGLRFQSGSDFKSTPYAFPSGYQPEGA